MVVATGQDDLNRLKTLISDFSGTDVCRDIFHKQEFCIQKRLVDQTGQKRMAATPHNLGEKKASQNAKENVKPSDWWTRLFLNICGHTHTNCIIFYARINIINNSFFVPQLISYLIQDDYVYIAFGWRAVIFLTCIYLIIWLIQLKVF